MFFGLCNSPMKFQTMMNDILCEFIHNSKVICYVDDILIYSHTLSEHQQIICQVLATLQEQRLFLQPEKCKFKQKEVEYLGLVILKDHVAMDPTKVCRVTVSFMNFYRKFIHNFSDTTCSLYALTCKTLQWVWGVPEQEAFDARKRAITSAPVLTFPSQSSHFCLECNASNFTTRAVLSQVQADSMHQPVTFMLKGISNVEHNYQIHNRELLAIMCTLEEWHHFLEGAIKKFEIQLLPLPPARTVDG